MMAFTPLIQPENPAFMDPQRDQRTGLHKYIHGQEFRIGQEQTQTQTEKSNGTKPPRIF